MVIKVITLHLRVHVVARIGDVTLAIVIGNVLRIPVMVMRTVGFVSSASLLNKHGGVYEGW